MSLKSQRLMANYLAGQRLHEAIHLLRRGPVTVAQLTSAALGVVSPMKNAMVGQRKALVISHEDLTLAVLEEIAR